MPLYEYFCAHCKKRFSIQRAVKFRDRMTKCPKCNALSHRALGKVSAIIYKGKGFHTTDYRKDE